MLDLLKANENLMVLWTLVRGYKFPKESITVKCQELGQYMSLMSECEVLYNSQSVSAFYVSFHTTVTRWAQFKINNTQSPARLLSSIYLEIDAF